MLRKKERWLLKMQEFYLGKTSLRAKLGYHAPA
jgi:hypothetical protein